MKAYTSAAMPAIDVSAPARSKCPGSRGVSVRNTGAAAATTIPMGRLMRNTQRQDAQAVITPPSTRPRDAPPMATAAYRASARLRLRPSGKAEITRARAAGEAIAAPTPCTARAAISQPDVVARPPASDARVKTAMPAMKVRRRPRMSPARPPSSSSPPNVSE
jgi:hypothetical protein